MNRPNKHAMRVHEVGNLPNQLAVVIAYFNHNGDALVRLKNFAGSAKLYAHEIRRAGWSEVRFGDLIVCDLVNDGQAKAVNARPATTEEMSGL